MPIRPLISHASFGAQVADIARLRGSICAATGGVVGRQGDKLVVTNDDGEVVAEVQATPDHASDLKALLEKIGEDA